MLRPLYVGIVNGKPVRFFPPQMDNGRPDLPGVSWDDMMTALGAEHASNAEFLRRLRTDAPDIARVIDTPDGPTTVLTCYAGLCFTAEAVEFIGLPRVQQEYLSAATVAAERFLLRWNGGKP